MGKKSVGEEFLGEKSVSEKLMGENSVSENSMMVYHVDNAHTIVFVYNAWIKALSLCTIEPRGKQCSECAIHNLVTIVEENN